MSFASACDSWNSCGRRVGLIEILDMTSVSVQLGVEIGFFEK